MKIIFHWDNIHFLESERPSFESRFKQDLKTAFKTNPKEAYVHFEKYTPGILSGFINDESSKILCSFTCKLLEGNTTTYDFSA